MMDVVSVKEAAEHRYVLERQKMKIDSGGQIYVENLGCGRRS